MEPQAPDIYKTIEAPTENVVFKELKSKFYGYAFPIENETEVAAIIRKLKKKHPKANHVCYAWQIGTENLRYRTYDDGEPHNSAETPIYGQIQAFQITNILVAVFRIFGGTKLGVGGLVKAYKITAQMALESAIICEKTVLKKIQIGFVHTEMDKVMSVVKKLKLNVNMQQFGQKCIIHVLVRATETARTKKSLKEILNVSIQLFDDVTLS